MNEDRARVSAQRFLLSPNNSKIDVRCSTFSLKPEADWSLGLGDCLELGLWELGFTRRAIFPSTKRPEKLGTFVQLLACTKRLAPRALIMPAWGNAKAEIPNPKPQVPRNFQIPMIQNQWRRLSGSGRLFENFSVGISLELGSWSFRTQRVGAPGSYEHRAVGAKQDVDATFERRLGSEGNRSE
jgi:hypothetical protein